MYRELRQGLALIFPFCVIFVFRQLNWHKKVGVNLWSRASTGLQSFEDVPTCGDLLASWKIALVKQANYTDLYTNPSAETIFELLQSSTMRPGPTGFWPDGKPHFFIVHDQPDAESRIWEWRVPYEKQNQANYASREAVRAQQREVAIEAESVDWGQFDLVVTIENAIPTRITKKFPKTKWATFIEHHRMPQYQQYLRQAPEGYDYFFTQRYGPTPQSFWQGKHAIDLSYGFKRPGDVSRLFPDVDKKPLVHVEDHQDLNAIRAQAERHGMDPLIFRSAHATSCIEYLRSLAESRIFYAPKSSRPLGGLANVDAASAGCVIIGDRWDLWNPSLICPAMNAGKNDFIKLQSLLESRDLFHQVLTEQNQRFSNVLIERPSAQVLNCQNSMNHASTSRI